MRSRLNHSTLAACAITLLAFALRVYRIDAVPLRGDEAFTLQVWTGPLLTVLSDVAPVEPQPPLVFASLRLWVALTGTSALAGRMYSALWSVLTIAPVYRLGRRLGGERTGLLAALLWAISPAQIWHAQDIRNYTLWATWSVMGVWLMLVSLETHHITRRIAYITATTAAAYSFYLEGIIIVFHNVYALWSLRKKPGMVTRWLITQAALAATLAPWYLQVPRLRSGGYQGTGVHLTTLAQVAAAIPETIAALLFGEIIPPARVWHAVAISIAPLSLLFGFTPALRKTTRRPLMLAGYTAVPLALFLILSTAGKYYRPRYLNGAAAAYLLALAVMIAWGVTLRHKAVRWLAVLTLVAMLALSAASLTHYYFDPAYAKAPNWPALAEFLNESVRPDDMIIRNVPDPTLDYYYQDERVAQTTLPATPDAPPFETETRLTGILDDHSRVWFLPTEHPVWDPDQTVSAYLEAHMQPVADMSIDGIPLQLWSPWAVSPDEVAHATDWRIADAARLSGFDSIPITDDDSLTLHPGDSLTLILYWQPLDNTSTSLTVFTHLIGPPKNDGSTDWAGHDHPPQYGRADTTGWLDIPLVRDPFPLTVPPDAPPATYTIHVGMYDAHTGQRMPITSPDDTTQTDSRPLLTVEVVP